MAERRMFAKQVVESDAFRDMGRGARLLYYDIGMACDDEGFLNSPKALIRSTGATMEDLQELIDNKFILQFESGVVVVKAWHINNYLQKDRVKPTNYVKEKSMLVLKENRMYTFCIHRVIKNRIDKNNISNLSNNISNSICEGLTPEQWDNLDNTFENLIGLIDLIDERLKLSDEQIMNPYAYIIKVAKKERWRTK